MPHVERPFTILLADDDPDDRVLFHEAIHGWANNFKIIEAEDGQQALDVLRSANEPPHIIVLDINMPRITGIMCAKMIRADERLKHLPIIMMSTSLNEETIAEAKNAGATRYVIKPGAFSELRAVIQYMCMMDWRSDISKHFILNEEVKKQGEV